MTINLREKLIVEKILYLIMQNNKKLFDNLPEIDADPTELLKRLQEAVRINGGPSYLIKLAKQTHE